MLITTTNGSMVQQQQGASTCLLKRKKETTAVGGMAQSPCKPPPPLLPKPKFILPHTSATQLAMQRAGIVAGGQLKAKSELNICMPSSSSSVVCSSSSTSSSSSNCSSSNQEAKPSVSGHLPSHAQHSQMLQQPIKNKLLENSSLVSSSAGYHSDTWESSHSSRQSFDEQPTNTHRKVTFFFKNCEIKI